MKNFIKLCFGSLLLAGLVGCAGYRWTSDVPEESRTISVPVFENRTHAAEIGPIATQYLLRELQREGTFQIRRSGDATIEIQGSIVKASRGALSYDRSYGTRANSYVYRVTAEISVIDKDAGKVLLDGRKYTAETTFLSGNDLLTGQRDAAQRIGQDLARQIVDDLTAWSFGKQGKQGSK